MWQTFLGYELGVGEIQRMSLHAKRTESLEVLCSRLVLSDLEPLIPLILSTPISTTHRIQRQFASCGEQWHACNKGSKCWSFPLNQRICPKMRSSYARENAWKGLTLAGTYARGSSSRAAEHQAASWLLEAPASRSSRTTSGCPLSSATKSGDTISCLTGDRQFHRQSARELGKWTSGAEGKIE